MAINPAHVSIDTSKNVRWTGPISGTYYTVLELHRFLSDLADDASTTSDDLIDATSPVPSDRSTDNIISLTNGYNIDDKLAEYLYDGSISQDSGNVLYSGVVIVGSIFDAQTEIDIIQNNQVVRNFWGTGINADAAANIITRMLIKTRTGGNDIDGKRLRIQGKKLGSTYAEFSFTAGTGNSFPALFTQQDLNNASTAAAIAAWTSILNVEGYQQIDLNNGNGPRDYYSQWDKGTQTINQLYERTKWIGASALIESSCTDTGSDFTVGNGTITGQAQSFANGVNIKKITKVRFFLKKTGAPTGNLTVTLHTHSGTFGSSSVPTGAALATSETFDVTRLFTSGYQEVEIRFLGAQQVSMSASTNYVIAVNYSGGDGSNYVQVRGLASSGTHAGNRSQNTGTWAATATDDLAFKVYSSPIIHGISGELFRGISHEVTYTGESGGPFVEDEILSWGTGATAGTGLLLALDDNGTTGTFWIQLLTGVVPTGTITGGTSSATATTGTVTARTVSPAFFGQSTGSSIIGAYGIGVQSADLVTADKIFDLTNTQQSPPNNQSGTVTGLVVGEDYVLVGPEDTGDLDYNQLTLNTTLSGAAETAVVVTAAIPSDTPVTGTIRIQLDTGVYRKVAYTSWSGSTFTIASTNFTGANQATAPRNVMITYIDKLAASTSESFTAVYASPRSMIVRVRDGGVTPIKPFQATVSFGATGFSQGAIRTPDL